MHFFQTTLDTTTHLQMKKFRSEEGNSWQDFFLSLNRVHIFPLYLCSFLSNKMKNFLSYLHLNHLKMVHFLHFCVYWFIFTFLYGCELIGRLNLCYLFSPLSVLLHVITNSSNTLYLSHNIPMRKYSKPIPHWTFR